jgi:hypothetical protein
MNDRPSYFESTRLDAVKRWDQLEDDPGLAAPWRQLFKQVQSPRHILSELLQNADDAGATEAKVKVEDGVFIFEHNGEDFIAEHFSSLCQFGFSNKRNLHTIGFRGIGFKSTFSLGDRVELYTPTLSVYFDSQRFTEPNWSKQGPSLDGKTRVCVAINDTHRKHEVEKNLGEWAKSPFSLLFFNSIRCLQIEEENFHWESLGSGPVPGSEWWALNDDEDKNFLLIRSEPEAFPDDALNEIRQERLLGVDQGVEFPPARVEILLRATGRLFVVLPTGVKTELPFACNAPFIQDPARLKIKDPEISPTNRWLLERVGNLASSKMQIWLNQAEMNLEERAWAYDLLPNASQEDNSLEGVCSAIVKNTFESALEGTKFLLTDDGNLTGQDESIIIPEQVFEIWPPEEITKFLDDRARPALCHYVKHENRKKLIDWDVISEIDINGLASLTQNKHLPKPKTWRQLLNLWSFIDSHIPYSRNTKYRIVPVQGKNVLFSTEEVVRLGEKKILQSEEDWHFLSEYLVALDQNWIKFLVEQRRNITDKDATEFPNEKVETAYALLQKIGLDKTGNVNEIMDRVSKEFFGKGSPSLKESVRLAQIAAKLDADASDTFFFFTQDDLLKSIKENDVFFDEDGYLEDVLLENHREKFLLHPEYVREFSSCSKDGWNNWVSSGKAGLFSFVQLSECARRYYRREKIEEEARRLGLKGDLNYKYASFNFVINDWDFKEDYWQYWEGMAKENEMFWVNFLERIINQGSRYWVDKKVKIRQISNQSVGSSMTHEALLPFWVLRLREVPCLEDTRGGYHKPGELLRRTPETESLIDLELFVHSRFDNESTRSLLDLLGVGDSPTGPDRLIDCLRALSRSDNPPIYEVEKWYYRLDQMVDTCSTSDLQKIKKVFRSEKLIRTDKDAWASAKSVYLSSDEKNVPGVSVIRSSVNDLRLWKKMGIEYPTTDLAIQWLADLPSGKKIPNDDLGQVKALMACHPLRIWEESGHWLNLAGEWKPTEELSYTLTMQSLVSWKHLYPWVKGRTANLQQLPNEITSMPPFSEIPALSQCLDDRFSRDPYTSSPPEPKQWITVLGMELSRVILDTEEETTRIRKLANILANTKWQGSPGLEITPYIEGNPVGTARRADVVWRDQILYVENLSTAKLAKKVPEELGKFFNKHDIKAALDYSFERSTDDIQKYTEENFNLAPIDDVRAPANKGIDDSPSTQISTSSPMNPVSDSNNCAQNESDNFQWDDADFDDLTMDSDENDLNDFSNSPAGGPAQSKRINKPKRLNIILRFARAKGFSKNEEGRFHHANGNWIGRSKENRVFWEHRNANGELIGFYFLKDHCLEQKSLQIEAYIWGLIDKNPEQYVLVLVSSNDEPVEVTGSQLLAMRDAGQITVYPATYRLVYNVGGRT